MEEWYNELFSKAKGSDFDTEEVPDKFELIIKDGNTVISEWDITQDLLDDGMSWINYTNLTLNLSLEFAFLHKDIFEEFRGDESLENILEIAVNDTLKYRHLEHGKERKGKERKGKGREGKGREGKGREGKGREGKGREGKGREGKGREGKGREGKGREGKGREGKGREGKGREGKGREGKGREGKGREGKGREGKGREGKGREGKGREGKGREGKGREGKGREGKGARGDADGKEEVNGHRRRLNGDGLGHKDSQGKR
ncbi:hypothetical protein ACHWQZ_G004867 [Mnemiopsis leidyi]